MSSNNHASVNELLAACFEQHAQRVAEICDARRAGDISEDDSCRQLSELSERLLRRRAGLRCAFAA